MSPDRSTLLFLVNDTDFFLSHRLNLATAARDAGHRCIVASPPSDSSRKLTEYGVEHLPTIAVRDRHGPVGLLSAFRDYWRVITEAKPDLVHLITSKPVILGGLIARLKGIPVVAAISGLGFVFTAENRRSRILRFLVGLGYHLALARQACVVIFQNDCDKNIFEELGVVRNSQVAMIKGSGVDLALISPHPEPPLPIVVLLPARLLQDKGVEEFVKASAECRRWQRKIIFRLQGKVDLQNPTGIPESTLERWIEEDLIQYYPHDPDADRMFARAHIVALPSYREGLPKSLVDAAAAGRPIVTTDVPGCRDAIIPGQTGLLVPVRDSVALAQAICDLADDREMRNALGAAGRRLAEAEYDVANISRQHLAIYQNLLDRTPDR